LALEGASIEGIQYQKANAILEIKKLSSSRSAAKETTVFFIEEPPRSLPSDENLSFCFFHVEGTRYCALCHGFAGLQATKYQRNKTPVSLAHHLPFFFYRGNPTVFSCRGNNGGTPVRVFFVWFVVFFCRGNLDRRIVCLFVFFLIETPVSLPRVGPPSDGKTSLSTRDLYTFH
jgi:hypothetical protein